MAVKVAINWFWPYWPSAFRQMFGAEGYEVVAINDLTKPSMLAHLLKYDTAQGGYCGKIGEGLHTVEADDEANTITVDGKTLKIYAEKDAETDPSWAKSALTLSSSARASTPLRRSPRRTSTLAQRRLSSPLRPATISRRSFTA